MADECKALISIIGAATVGGIAWVSVIHVDVRWLA